MPKPIAISALSGASLDSHLKLITRLLPGVFFALDQAGRFITVEGRGCVQMRLDAPTQLPGRMYTEVFADEPGLMIRLKHTLADTVESHWTAEVRGHTWEFHCAPLRDPDGHPSGMTVFALDVTQRHYVEGEIRWRNRELTALNAITAALTGTLDFSQVLATLERQIATHLNVQGGAVYLQGHSGLELYTAWGIDPDLIARTSDVITSNDFWSYSQPAGTSLLNELFVGSSKEGLFWQCGITIPLTCNNRSLGTLALYGSEPFTFSRHRSVFFETLGHQVGAALQNARMFRTVSDGQHELQHLTHRLVSAQEAERTRLARELHDEFGQILTCMKMSLELAERPDITPETAVFHRTQVRSLVDDMLAHVRHMTLELRTTVLDDLGLVAALQWYSERFTAQTNILVTLDHSGVAPEQRFAEPLETAAYRIVQEALTNVARHANVEQVYVALTLRQTTSCHAVSIIIEDSGNGFDKSEKGRRMSCGLTGMRERAIALGGTLSVNSAPGCGTRVELLLPMENSR